MPEYHATSTTPYRHRIIRSLAALTIVAIAGLVWYGASFVTLPVDAAGLPGTPDLEQQLAPRKFVLAQSVPDSLLADISPEGAAHEVEQTVEVEQGDTLIGLLADAGIDRSDARDAIAALQDVFAPKELKPGQKLRLDLSLPAVAQPKAGDSRLIALSLQPSVDRDVRVTRDADGRFVAAAVERPLTREVVRAVSTVDSSLFEAGHSQEVPPSVTAEVIRAFSYDVDFQRDIHSGDGYEVLYQQFRTDDGEVAKNGDVLYAALTLNGRRLEIYRFTPSDGRPDFFNPMGESIRKALLRTPIDGARISSGFGMRKHPILGYSRMHKGIDFAAPKGTPIFAAGDGTVVRVGRNGSYGNYIRIRHNSKYATAYAHINRFAKGLKKGDRVHQGDVIAYVGATGRATGPHLHYEILANSKQVNPMSVNLPTGQTLEGKDLAAFQAAKAEIDRLRKHLSHRVLIARKPATDCAEEEDKAPGC